MLQIILLLQDLILEISDDTILKEQIEDSSLKNKIQDLKKIIKKAHPENQLEFNKNLTIENSDLYRVVLPKSLQQKAISMASKQKYTNE